MDISTRYTPSDVEEKWYDYWIKQGFFHSEPDDREPYCIVIPPPNVTGVLHMGHMLNNTIQDVLVRKARMEGKNACWVPGTDHASIATEAKVVAKLREEGIDKGSISREAFLEHAWEWKEKHGGIILEQLKKLGASCDWERTCFTMDEPRYDAVMDVFIDLYRKGLIYRGARMVNWDPKALTAVSDEEVIYKEVQSSLYYVRYAVEGEEDGWITIATTRPETILGDTGICVHPEDERYKHLQGKRVLVPLIKRAVPVIFDAYVDREFGTGALKVTPAHDINDYNLGLKYHLDVIDTFNPNGTMSDAAQRYIGEERFAVRKRIVEDLQAAGHMVKIEAYTNKVGYSERTDEVIEPRISVQWFMKMGKMAKEALEVVENDRVKFHPAKYRNMYRHWMENVQDWCISRQLWWGHRIPAWYLPDGTVLIGKTKQEAWETYTHGTEHRAQSTEHRAQGTEHRAQGTSQQPTANSQQPTANRSEAEIPLQRDSQQLFSIADLQQDPDVLDTWFSSWLWPISVFDGIRHSGNPDIQYYYPTNDLVTAPEIIFFWVARMIMAGLEYKQDIPFHNVYFTGIVRDKLGRKMSKSLGNSPEPLLLIREFGADAVRMGMLLCSPAGNDLLFDDALIEQGRNFSNKLWNAFRLVQGWEVDQEGEPVAAATIAIEWFASQYNQTLSEIERLFASYKLSEALMQLYKLFWDDFCSWYLEMVKPEFGRAIDAGSYRETIGFFESLLRLLHPYVPFITEEVWHLIGPREENSTIMHQPYPTASGKERDESLLPSFAFAADVITAIRSLRAKNGIPAKESVGLCIRKNQGEMSDSRFDPVIMKLCGINEISYVEEKVAEALSVVVRTTEFFIPYAADVDCEAELAKLRQELTYTQGFLRGVENKLSNDRFVSSAPAQIVENERKKKSDAEARIRVLEERIHELMKK